ncbi:Archease domain-containing protein [Pelagophyceae sp. CCMP2097]|nr:Archease domain-containing protein [Pelagophyceae sp. CCMP2097]
MGVSEHKGQNYEHLDHTADVQFHAWGDSLEAAVSSLGDCFFDYVTDRSKIAEDESCAQTFQVSAADGPAFIFRFLDELLFRFSADNIACATVKVDALVCTEGSWSATVSSTGERFDLSKHPQGCEVKAITYSNMQIHQDKGRHDLFVIVDI